MRIATFTALPLAMAFLATAAPPPAVVAARAWREANERRIVSEFFDLLRIPNIASDTPNIRKNADAIRVLLEKRGASTRLLEVPGAPPVVYGELSAPGATQTVVFYAHYDGQPTDPKEWKVSGPWQPSFRADIPAAGPLDPELRIYARSASDDKAPIQAMVSALDALKDAGQRPSVNIKFVFEGEEEAGSASLGRILAAHKDLIKADFWLICDGPVHQTRRQQVVFGARGVTSVQLTVYGPRRELHSGHYGNWAPNPAWRLARLLATMRDDDGRILIAGYYDGIAPLTPTERQALAEEPAVDETLKKELLLASTDNAPRKLSDTINEPSLNIRGLSSAAVGAASHNVIPAEATASIDLRLVKGNDYRAMVDKLRAHVRAQGYFVVEDVPDEATRLKYPKVARIQAETGYNAVRTSMDLPVSRQVVRAVESARGPVVKAPTSGGSVPLSMIEEVVGVPLISVPIVNHDNSQHSVNENLRLQNLWDGIETMAALFTMRPAN
jgi:acetylornithine deacetylase/succinyl-diaminopimelate desuccinylase-like protein